MDTVVTGATGNIGTALARALRARGHRVIGVARRPPQTGSDDGLRWLAADLTTAPGQGELRSALRGAEALVHLAWPLQPMRRRDYLHRSGPDLAVTCLGAALDAGVDHLVHMSSVAAYRPGPHEVLVGEDWPLGGVPSSTYAQHKAEGERRVAALLHERGADRRAAVMRPCLVGQRSAGGQFMRTAVPTPVPGAVVRHLPMAPFTRGFSLQMVHSDDVADATVAALERRAHGAFNLAADGLVTGEHVAAAMGTRVGRVPMRVIRQAAALAWHARLMPLDPGWIDMALQAPFVSSARAREELGWAPRHTARDVLAELTPAMADGTGGPTPPLRPRSVRRELAATVRRGDISRRQVG